MTRAKLSVVADPSGVTRITIGNMANLSDDEARFAADYASLGEDINVLRGVYQATGFRGPEALQVLLGQRGNLLGNPKVFQRVLTNSLQSVTSQLVPMHRELSRAGQPLPVTDGLIHAYLILAGGDSNKATKMLKRDGWE